ncbi:RNA-directed DNA polymerase, eukaryota, reverse transcriptase zinc-binding domain protein [Tanacetum coccineum]
MSNKKRPPKRKPKIPNKFNDHIMSNLSPKRKNSSDVDDLDAIRVPTEDKVEIIGEIGESSKEKVMEEGECVEELIHVVNDVASSNLKSGDEKHNGIDKELNKGVFGNADSEAKNDISSGVMNEDAERGLNYGIPNPFIDCSSDNHKTASNEAHNSRKVVIFDEELVKDGSEKWKYTVCGYFVGYRMGINELSPWLVNGKPLLVQKWDQETTIVREAPCKIPIWIRLVNIPLEAWNVRGISALASRLGRPIKMDQVTADMCRTGAGRLGYARVLIEINAEDEFFDKIEINYMDGMENVKSTKWVVDYTWKPDRCSHCKVFGHSVINCVMKPKPKTTVHNQARPNAEKNIGASKEGFVEVTNIKNSYRRVWNKEHQGNKHQPIGVKVAYKPKEAADKSKEGTQERTKHQETRAEVNKSPKVWNVGKDNIEELRKSASKYAVLSDEDNNIEVDPFLDKRLIVDEFIKKKLQPTCEETRDWNYDMINYFKIQWEEIERQDLECSDDDDVFEMNDQATHSFIADKC